MTMTTTPRELPHQPWGRVRQSRRTAHWKSTTKGARVPPHHSGSVPKVVTAWLHWSTVQPFSPSLGPS